MYDVVFCVWGQQQPSDLIILHTTLLTISFMRTN
jgi:hypothetical protein